MTISNLPSFFNMVFTEKEGRLAPDGYLYLDQQFQVLNNTVFTANSLASTIFVNLAGLQPPILLTPINAPALIGINPPIFTTAQINAIIAITPSIVPLGTIWYNSSVAGGKLQFLNSGGIQTITSTP